MATSDYRMPTADARLRGALEGRGGERILTLDPAFSGLPDTAHGGSVLAAVDALAGGRGPRTVRGLYRRRVPLGVPLRLSILEAGDAHEYRLADTMDTLLVEGAVAGAGPPAAAAPPAAVAAWPLPVSTTCFACGVQNPIGLRLRLAFDDGAVAGRWEPRAAFRAPDGALAPVALTTMLDEAAFWLGALASGESGMTTELSVTIDGPVPFGTPLVVGGRRERVRPLPGDPRYWTTEVAAWDEAGRVVAQARITFVAVRGAARRLAGWLLGANAAEVVARVFPAYVR